MPLTDPVPSSSFDVLERNVQDTDKFVNQETGTFTNRVGKQVKPIPVIEAEANAAVILLGWHQVGLFADGFTYLLQNDIAKDATGDWYRWNGALPKVVTAGTSPSSDANFVKIDYKSHADLSDRNPADGSAHNADDVKDTKNGGSVQNFIDNIDQVHTRTFANVAAMLAFNGLALGSKLMTFSYNQPVVQHWEVVSAGNGVSGGLLADDLTLYVDGNVWVKDVSSAIDHRHFGAYGDVNESTKVGTSDTPAIQAYAAYIKASKSSVMKFSAGNILFGEPASNTIDLQELDFDLTIKGEGLATRFIRGNGAVTSKFARIFFIRNLAGKSINIEIDGFYVDDNSLGNPLSGSDAFEYQSAHVFAVLPVGYRGFNNVSYKNIYGVDIIADLCGCGGNALDTVRSYNASNIIVPRRDRQRFDVGITCSYDYFTATNCDVVRIEVETNSTDARDIGSTKLVNVSSDDIDMLYKPTIGTVAPTLQTTNCTSRKFAYVAGFNWIDVKSNLLLQGPMRFLGNGESVPCRLVLDGTSFKKSDTYTNPANKPFLWIESAATSPTKVKFINDYTIDAGDQIAFGDLNASLASKSIYFGRGDVKSTNSVPISLRSGVFTFDGVEFYGNGDGASPLIYQENVTSTLNSNTLTVHNCTAKTNNPLLRMASGTASRAIDMRGNTPFSIDKVFANLRADKLKSPWGTGTEISVLGLDTFNVTDGVPAVGNFIRGNKFNYLDPTSTGYVGAVCINTGAANSTNIKQFGLIA